MLIISERAVDLAVTFPGFFDAHCIAFHCLACEAFQHGPIMLPLGETSVAVGLVFFFAFWFLLVSLVGAVGDAVTLAVGLPVTQFLSVLVVYSTFFVLDALQGFTAKFASEFVAGFKRHQAFALVNLGVSHGAKHAEE